MHGQLVVLYPFLGNANSTDKYRGITLVSCLGKLFTSILNKIFGFRPNLGLENICQLSMPFLLYDI